MATLQELEDDDWGEPPYDSYLVTECHRLRRKVLDQFTIEDLRIMVGQGISLPHLAPRAIAVLEHDPLAEGDFFPGDLLEALIRPANWSALRTDAERVFAICRRVLNILDSLREQELPDGRFVAPDLALKLKNAIQKYLDSQ